MIEPKVPVDAAYLNTGRWEVEIAGARFPCVVSATPLYDPQMLRIKV
jgi:4-methylaminobutanoate oxidase (formaldehyde-forming)